MPPFAGPAMRLVCPQAAETAAASGIFVTARRDGDAVLIAPTRGSRGHRTPPITDDDDGDASLALGGASATAVAI